MTIRPIIFSAPMVRALLEGRKTQTRRVLKPKRGVTIGQCVDDGPSPSGIGRVLRVPRDLLAVPYACGDLLYVREAWRAGYCTSMYDEALGRVPRPSDLTPESTAIEYLADGTFELSGDDRPSIHMPRWASRLTLAVTDVRVQRVREISNWDAIAEGATKRPNCYGWKWAEDGWSMNWDRPGLTDRDVAMANPQGAFFNYWNYLHGDGSAARNPWVVAVTFSVHKCNVDSFAQSVEGGLAA